MKREGGEATRLERRKDREPRTCAGARGELARPWEDGRAGRMEWGASAPSEMGRAQLGGAVHEIGEKGEFSLDVAFVPAAID
jgi:hypothetical protein